MRRRGRPGLLGTVARTAVISGTAQAVGGRVQRKQQQAWAAEAAAQAAPPEAAPTQAAAAPQPVAPAPAPAPADAPSMDDKLAQLQQLGELRDQGILTDAEFEASKAQILGT